MKRVITLKLTAPETRALLLCVSRSVSIMREAKDAGFDGELPIGNLERIQKHLTDKFGSGREKRGK